MTDRFIVGVPDSTLPGLGGLVAANEGNAVGMAIGYYLATGKTPIVYMQNSGLWNAMNPITSLVIPYNIPMTFVIGMRNDGPHKVDGEITSRVLRAMGIWFDYITTAEQIVPHRCKRFAYLYVSDKKTEQPENTDREKTIERILQEIPEHSIVVSATGKISRELYALREEHTHDFLCTGGMGHCIQVAAGIAREKHHRHVVCLDGDGSVLMHLGGLAVIAQMRLRNLTHIMLNNGAHDSVGGVPTVALDLDWKQITEGMGYRYSRELSFERGPVFVELFVAKGARADLGRPDLSPTEAKKIFMDELNEDRNNSL